jgi:hypothetical protein
LKETYRLRLTESQINEISKAVGIKMTNISFPKSSVKNAQQISKNQKKEFWGFLGESCCW